MPGKRCLLYVTDTGLVLGSFDTLTQANLHHDCLLYIYDDYGFPPVTFFVHD